MTRRRVTRSSTPGWPRSSCSTRTGCSAPPPEQARCRPETAGSCGDDRGQGARGVTRGTLVRAWVAWWVVGMALWLLLEDLATTAEDVDGAVAAALGASAAVVALSRARPRPRPLRGWSSIW